eukprot:scaffold21228_cov38-Attheya_sp.AAC.1
MVHPKGVFRRGSGESNMKHMSSMEHTLGQRFDQESHTISRNGTERSRHYLRTTGPSLDRFEIIQHERIESNSGEETQIAFCSRPTHLVGRHYRVLTVGSYFHHWHFQNAKRIIRCLRHEVLTGLLEFLEKTLEGT